MNLGETSMPAGLSPSSSSCFLLRRFETDERSSSSSGDEHDAGESSAGIKWACRHSAAGGQFLSAEKYHYHLLRDFQSMSRAKITSLARKFITLNPMK